MALKMCHKCKKIKPVDEFVKRRSTKDGLDYVCKVCKREESRLRDREKHRQCQREYRKNNKEKIYQYNKDYRKTVKGHIVKKICRQSRRSRKRQSENTLTANDWENIVQEFNHECAYCGRKNCKLDQEHIVPLSKGGNYTKQNIIPACRNCNSSKRTSDMETWFIKQDFFDENRLNKIYKHMKCKQNVQQLALF